MFLTTMNCWKITRNAITTLQAWACEIILENYCHDKDLLEVCMNNLGWYGIKFSLFSDFVMGRCLFESLSTRLCPSYGSFIFMMWMVMVI